MSTHRQLASRRDLLAARTDLERVDFAVAARDLVASFGVRGAAGRFRDTHPLLSRALRLAIPLLGAGRIGVVARALSIGLVVYRAVRAVRALRGRRRAAR